MATQFFLQDFTAEGGNGKSADAHRLALNAIFTAAYEELRRLASTIRRGDPHATLNPTALVNEAWFKLADYPTLGLESKLDFKRIAARAMRQLLIESARRRNAEKRGSDVIFVTLDESMECTAACARDLLALDAALDELAKVNPRQATMVECRFFAGLEASEIASQLNVSEATVVRDWRAAKAWLAAKLRTGN